MLLSGGVDSVCLLDVAVTLGAEVSALHVNYGLRPTSDGDEEFCRDLCARLGVPLQVERVTLPEQGNLQASARDLRYELAEAIAVGDYATGHTASDQAETVLYRLASSPGGRALLGMKPRRGRLVRPLLEVTRAATREHCHTRGLEWREDESNRDPRFARARIRHEVLPVLEQLAPGAEARIAASSKLLAEEYEVLRRVVDETIAGLGEAPKLERLRALEPALARLVVQALAERGGSPALSGDAIERIFALSERGGTVALDVGGGVRAVVEYGRLRFTRTRARETPESAELAIPGRTVFGAYEITAGPEAAAGDGPSVELSADRLERGASVRAWLAGDRMRPAGLGGSRKLQELFTDRKVPREARSELPLVVVGGEVAWVPGVAVGENFLADSGAGVLLRVRRLDE